MSTSPNPNPAPAAGDPPAAPVRPEYIPEKFWDPATNAPKIEDLAKSYAGLETKFGKGKEAYDAERLAKRPESADKYEFAIEGVDKEALDKWAMTPVLREVAFELGLPPEEANGVVGKLVAALTKDAPKPEEEMRKLGDNAEARLHALDAYIGQHFTDPEERAALEFVGRTAAGVRVIEKLIAQAGGKPLDPPRDGGGPAGPQAKTKKEIDTMMQDPRYWSPRHRDEAFVKEVQDWFASQGR